MTKAGGKEYWKLWARMEERSIENYEQGWRKGVLKTMTKAGEKEYWKLWPRLEERSIEKQIFTLPLFIRKCTNASELETKINVVKIEILFFYLKISLFMEKLRSLMIYATLKQEMIQDIYGGRRLYK